MIKQQDWRPIPEVKLSKAIERDAKLWEETIRPLRGAHILPGPASRFNAQTGFIRRLLLTFKFLEFRPSTNDNWRDWPFPACAALSHGGRILINFPRLPGKEKLDKHWFWSWLLCGNEAIIDHGKWASSRNHLEELLGLDGRSYSSHGTSVGNGGLLIEKKGGGQNITRAFNPHTHQYGMNIALGGYGNEDAKGNRIRNDGFHGHLLIIYRTSDRYNGILVGCENKEHGKKGKTHLGTGHSALGRPQSVSATGNLKWDGYAGVDVPGKVDCMRVILNLVKFGELKRAENNHFYAGWHETTTAMNQTVEVCKRGLAVRGL
ncbi:MAG: hypothetical protein MUO43_11865 [Desulfobacterales bacterium]|nr:hypothetical protein [Desulfobacterales bacterium]